MEILIWCGAVLTLGGVGLLIWCVIAALSARRAGLEDAALRARLQKLTAVNLGALSLSGLGLMLIVVGGLIS
ncbi:MAG: hypothetical protein AAGF74_10250 [Pseudomonadota bacterium]